MDYYSSGMESDPFSTLGTNLDDISDVIRGMEVGQSQEGTMVEMEAGTSWQHNDYMATSSGYSQCYRPNQHSPPQEYYDQTRNQEVSGVVSLLHDSPVDDPYGAIKFSPPNLEGNPLMSSTARMLPQLRPTDTIGLQHHVYPQMTLAQQLAAPAMQPSLQPTGSGMQPVLMPEHPMGVVSPPDMYVDTQMSSPHNYPSPPTVHCKPETKPTYMVSPVSVKMESEPSTSSGYASGERTPRKSSSTKEELLRMLVNMSPSEVDRLKRKDIKVRPAAVATRVSRDPGWSDEEDEDSADERPLQVQIPQRRGPKTERRTAHNLIEKKYRCSINDRIQQLKDILGGDDKKLSKSATLRLAIERIEQLEDENTELKIENEQLIAVLKTHNIEIVPMPPATQASCTSPVMSPTTSQSPGSVSSPLSPPLGSKRPRMDQQRVTMCALMFAVLLWNPLSLIDWGQSANFAEAAQDRKTMQPHGRILDDDLNAFGTDSDGWWNSRLTQMCFIWGINVFVVVCILTRLLVYGEPVQDFKSRQWLDFLQLREKARIEVEAGNVKEAQRQYVECLQLLERPLPSAGLDSLFSVTWQVVRHLLNWLWVGRWFARRRRDAGKPVTVVCKSLAHTAVIYHKINQLQLVGVDETNGTVSGLYLALSAVNLAESAGASIDGLPRSVMADIYIAAAVRTRLCLPPVVAQVVSMYFYRRAQRHVRRADENSVDGIRWMFHPLGKQFLADPRNLKESLSYRILAHSMVPFIREDFGCVVSRLRAFFKLWLLSQLTGQLTGESEGDVDVPDTSRLLISMSTKTSDLKTKDSDYGTSISEGDSLCTWWTHVLTCALYWRQGLSDRAKKHYSIVRHCPKELLATPLALAVGHSFCGRKLCVDDRNNVRFVPLVHFHSKQALQILRRVGGRGTNTPVQPLQILRRVGGRGTNTPVQPLQESLRRLSYEWVMSSVLDAWRNGLDPAKPYWTQSNELGLNTLYQEAVNHYTFITENNANSSSNRLFVYQLASRMLNGANPAFTYTNVCTVKRQTIDAVQGSNPVARCRQPDPFHLHVLIKMHSDLTQLSGKIKGH